MKLLAKNQHGVEVHLCLKWLYSPFSIWAWALDGSKCHRTFHKFSRLNGLQTLDSIEMEISSCKKGT
ncbi:hypothetical protein DKX38_024605 [Salix brachista]|uniref:Uncharacterized protein n=1 Tax=Salix brachista TaxID=2182728 RepID=A0A5N5JNN0_9ROSI|nr:hypothetical protein DKX38_024605 [Salix brachista]